MPVFGRQGDRISQDRLEGPPTPGRGARPSGTSRLPLGMPDGKAGQKQLALLSPSSGELLQDDPRYDMLARLILRSLGHLDRADACRSPAVPLQASA